MYSPTIQKLIDLFSKFPTVGPRTAGRFVFYLMRKNKEEGEFCQICSDPRRDKALLCVVANEPDLEAIEKIKKYKGFYFILGGTVSALKKTDIEKLRFKELG